jgi:hypothetical protein
LNTNIELGAFYEPKIHKKAAPTYVVEAA